ncbi:transcription repressor NadR [Ureibacillus composti]|nr:transcription repressor NadR [Ureibacillus composti]
MKKMLGENRRNELLNLLRKANGPLKGTELAKHTNVSRQVIVNDMNLLKARNEPILATSQGYIYIQQDDSIQTFERKIVCLHTPQQAEDEMITLVDCGVTLKNVIVEHPVYGEITASIMVSNRFDVTNFIEHIKETNASLLSDLTDGTHLHVISATSIEQLDHAEQMLREKGYLIEG